MSKTVKVEFRIPYNRGFKVEQKDVPVKLWEKIKSKPDHKRTGNWKFASEVTENEVLVLNLEKKEEPTIKPEVTENEVLVLNLEKKEEPTIKPEVTENEVKVKAKPGPKPKNKEEEKQEDETQE